MKSRAKIEDISDVDVTIEENEEVVTDYHDEDLPKSPVPGPCWTIKIKEES